VRSQQTLLTTHTADEVLQALAVFLRDSKQAYLISEKAYKITVTQEIEELETREVKY
jgi:PHD/YefM family antitoxin component YafN of YafNO toxin-antitoxin module